MKKTILIIGGGLGGLFSGAFLAKEGYKVTVLEKNHIIGGGLQSFFRHGTEFETGMHILAGFTKGGSLHKICSYLGIMDKLSIRPTDKKIMDTVTYFSDSKTYSIPQGREAFVNYFSTEFPEEKENIKAYVDTIYQISEEVDLFHLRKSNGRIFNHSEQFLWAADDLIKYYIKSPKLQDVLAYMTPLYDGEAQHTPAYVHALINVLYINGSCMFNNGSLQLANLLNEIIAEGGGQVISGEEVTQIEVENKNVISVKTSKGNTYTAEKYISSIHPCNLLEMSTPGAFPKSYQNRLNEIPNSCSSFTVYIKFKENSFPYINHPCYYQDDYGLIWNHSNYNAERWPQGFMCLTPPVENQGTYASRMTVNCLMGFDQVQKWQDTKVGRRGKEYEAWEEKHINLVLNRLETQYPGFKESIEYTFAASPLTIRDYFGTKNGSLYGFQKDCQNISLSQMPLFTKVKNLFLTGQNINLHGICGVPLTAIETAEAIVGNGTIIDKINDNYKL